MSEAASPVIRKDARGLGARLWEYQAERFPVFKHGALIVAFGASAVCLSAMLRDGGPSLVAIDRRATATARLFGRSAVRTGLGLRRAATRAHG